MRSCTFSVCPPGSNGAVTRSRGVRPSNSVPSVDRSPSKKLLFTVIGSPFVSSATSWPSIRTEKKSLKVEPTNSGNSSERKVKSKRKLSAPRGVEMVNLSVASSPPTPPTPRSVPWLPEVFSSATWLANPVDITRMGFVLDPNTPANGESENARASIGPSRKMGVSFVRPNWLTRVSKLTVDKATPVP